MMGDHRRARDGSARPWGARSYQILREALVNAARHAPPTMVRVILRLDWCVILMTIADDSEGFPFTGRHDLATPHSL
jgi:signal transduction histidine kinase